MFFIVKIINIAKIVKIIKTMSWITVFWVFILRGAYFCFGTLPQGLVIQSDEISLY